MASQEDKKWPDLFCIGNPLLDMQVTNGEPLLERYNLKPNDAILAAPEQMGLYDDIVKSDNVKYVAGGAAQNAARGAAYILPPGSVVYTGCVADDDLAEKLREANQKEGVQSAYMVTPGAKSGACGVVITGHHRSLVTTLRAAESFDKSHLSSPEVAPLIEHAKLFYIEGFFLTHGVESAVELAKAASEASKIVALNLSAPFIPQFFKVQLERVIAYSDFIMGNDAEAEAWATAAGLPDPKDHVAVARSIALLPKSNAARSRVVVITRGTDSTVYVSSSAPNEPKELPVTKLPDDQIVDTNGAGDAFAGGFMAGLVLGKSLDECVEIGHRMGAMNIGQVGPQYKWPKVQII